MIAIETEYNGYRFRSRTEARWAIFFDEAGISYAYEPEGFKFEDGTMYLPDFYLKDQKIYFECKGMMNQEDEHKIILLSKGLSEGNDIVGAEVIIGYPDMTFDIATAIHHIHKNDAGEYWVDEEPILSKSDNPWICKCRKCGKTFFLDGDLSWACNCCGYYDGDRGFEIMYWGNDPSYCKFDPIEKAKRARFEHGEKG